MRRFVFMIGLFVFWTNLSGYGQAQTSCPSPGRATTKSRIDLGSYTLGLHGCFNRGETIECTLILTIVTNFDPDWLYKNVALFQSKLVDNFGIEHAQTLGYFQNGRCESQNYMNLTKGQKAWVVQDFEAARSDITRAKIIFPTQESQLSLSGPVVNSAIPVALRLRHQELSVK